MLSLDSYTINISLDGDAVSDTLTLFCSKQDVLKSGECTVNNEIQNGDMNFEIGPAPVNNSFLLKWFVLICISMIFLIVFVWFKLLAAKQYKIENIFLLFILILGTIYVFIMPPFTVPDEPAHYTTAYHVSNIIMGVKEAEEGQVVCRESDKDDAGMFQTSVSLSEYRYIEDNLFAGSSNNENNGRLHVGFIIQCARHAHLPQALGITVARLFGFSYSGLLILGRMFALIFYAVMTYYAIKIIPVGKNMLFAVSSLPMLLHEVASFSYDCNILALAFLLTSYLLYLIYEKERLELKDYVIVAVLSVLLAPCKMVYFPIILLALAIPGKKINNRLRTLFIKVVIPFAAAIAAVAGNIMTVTNVSGENNIIAWANEEGYTISYVLSHIPHTIQMYLNTLYEKMEFYLDSMVGGCLGWFEVDIPGDLTMISVIILVISIFECEKYNFRKLHRILYFVIFAGISAMIMATMLLGWTPISYQVIEGVQGRYILPVLPLLLLACRMQTTEKQTVFNQKIVILGSCIVNYMVVMRILAIVSNA